MKGIFTFIVLIALCANSVSSQQYRPKKSNRVKFNFNTNWKFFRGSIHNAEAYSYDDTAWELVNLPHAAYIEPLVTDGWQGECWYRKHFKLKKSYAGKKVFIEFEGAMQVSEIWINGIKKHIHYGGYLPFAIDITSDVAHNETEIVIAVKLVNTDDGTFPPGKAEAGMDYCYFHGLYRDVWVHITDQLHITDAVYAGKVASGGVFVYYSEVSPLSAVVNVKTHVQNDDDSLVDCEIETEIIDKNNSVVASQISNSIKIDSGSDNSFNQGITVSNPNLWSPENPYLYTVRTSVKKNGIFVDDYSTPIGIRTINFSKDGGFTINGNRIKFRGVNRHQDYPYVGNAVPNNAQYRDALKIKEAGFQYVRTSHYPQDPAFLDACDELGLLVMACIPSWQFWRDNTVFRTRSYEAIRDMIRRDRNHPCIIAWEASLNESLFDEAFAVVSDSIVHQEYPGNAFSAGWRFENRFDVFLKASQHGTRKYNGSKPLIISEYGDWDYGGNSSTSRVERGANDTTLLKQAWNHQESLNRNMALPWLSGDGLWIFNDYNRGYRSDLCLAGPVDIFRLPKYSYYFFQSQRDPNHIIGGVNSGPMVFIASKWLPGTNQVKIYSNCEQVELFVNDNLVEVRNPDTDFQIENLPHPPFTFNLPFQYGKLEAKGKIGSIPKASHAIHTPGNPDYITLEIDTCGKDLIADGSDLVMVYAYVRSADGYIVTDAKNTIEFAVNGHGTLVGANSKDAEAGIAAALLKATKTQGDITVTAHSAGLTPGSTKITSLVMKNEYQW